MNNNNNWITFPDGYSCDLNAIRAITTVYKQETSCIIILRFDGDKRYEWEFPYKNYADSKEELIQKVEKLREKLVIMANHDEEPLRAVTFIDLKKHDNQVTG